MIVGKPLLTEEQIQSKVIELAEKINNDYHDKELLAIGVLKGAFMFFADLIRHLKVPLVVDFLTVSSYIKMNTTNEVKIHSDIRENVVGRDVLLIEDIIDTGISLNYIRERILENSPKSFKTCVLLDKKERRLVDVPVEYIGFEVPNVFVIGYGIDYDDKFRNLPYISIFKDER